MARQSKGVQYMTGAEIVTRARSLSNYRYWYGGKREVATVELANQLKRENPDTWDALYYSAALADVDGTTRVCDCSGLVCYAYDIGDISSYGIRSKYKVWPDAPRAGMIGWRKGHVGIFSADGWDAPIIEMRSRVYDYQCRRTYAECGFTAVLYDPAIDYSTSTGDDIKKVGWHADNLGWWYRHTAGTGKETYYYSTLVKIGRHWYYFKDDGYIYEMAGDKLARVSPESETGWIV